jgi:branched-subunit amino acid transport protein
MDQAYFTSFMTVALTRATERMLLVLVGALAIYLGYNLFIRMPNAVRGKHDGEGKIELPGGVSIFLTRVGPGIFFALFGIAVIGYSVTRPVNLDFPAPTTVASAGGSAGGLHFSGFAQSEPARPAVQTAIVGGPEPEIVVARLNGIFQKAQSQMNTVEAEELAQMIRAAKFSVILGRWKPEWGDRAAFERWVREHANQDPPANLVPGVIVVFNSVLP